MNLKAQILRVGWARAMGKPRIRYYRSFSQDFNETRDQDYRVPENYRWVRRDLSFRAASAAIYWLAIALSNIYCRLFLHVKLRGAGKLRRVRDSGIYLYGNHTQPVGDVFDPALLCFPRRIHTLASPANLAIPVIGKLLPYLGALPISDTLHGTKALMDAVAYRLQQKRCIVIYPEAHVWEYCTEIRPFSETAFKFPVKFPAPVFCMTTTYQKRRFGKKPGITIYIDGPFAMPEGTPREQARQLQENVHHCMTHRSAQSNVSYIQYVPDQAEDT